MHSHKEGRPRLVAGDARHLTNETPCINGSTRPNVKTDGRVFHRARLAGILLFCLTAGAALYLAVHVAAAFWGWQGGAMFALAGWLLTLVAAAGCSRSSR